MDWTDDRLQERFDSIDRRFDEVDRRFEQVDQRFDRVEGEIRGLRSEMNQRFDALNRTLLQLGGGMIVTFAVGIAGVIVAQ